MLNESLIQTLAGSQIFERGAAYYQQGAVHNAFRRGDLLTAEVEGSEYAPYQVNITLDQGGIASFRCTCPYADEGHICKHIAAVLLAYVRNPAAFVVRPKSMTLIQDLSLEQLKALWEKLLLRQPEIADWLETAVSGLTADTASRKPRQTPLNLDSSYRRQIAQILRAVDYSRPYQTIWAMTERLGEVQEQANAFLTGGDARNAIAILTEIAEQVIPQYGELEDETQLADYLSDWAETMAEAILSADLMPGEKAELTKRLDDWSNALADYSAEESIELARTALAPGWAEISENDDLWGGGELTELKLKIAERTQDVDTYLAQCLTAGAYLRYALKLVAVGRVEDAYQHALAHLRDADEALALAQTLQAADAFEKAYAMGRHGLTLPGPKYALGRWLAIFSESLGRTDTALTAWQVAFENNLDLEIYQHLKRLSGNDWKTLRPRLMKLLEAPAAYGSVRPLIEALIDDADLERAMAVWDQTDRRDYILLDKLVTAAASGAPDWAIREALAEANSLISRGSKYYVHAEEWLSRVKAIYQQHQRLPEWSQCIHQIRATHHRKYSLIASLKGL